MSEIEELRRDFVANVSHELRTPVAVIRANAETLLAGALEDAQEGRRLAEAIERNAQRLTDLISDLLDLSRIEAGNYGLSLRSLRVSKAVHRALEAVDELARKRDVTVAVDVDPRLYVHADKRGFDQVLINLLDNAVKHTPSGLRVRVRADIHEGGVRVEVEDEGPGVDPRHRDRVFERFFRADRGRSRHKGGTGLGLAIVKHLTDLMNGQVGVRSSREESGAVFWLVLPRAQPDGIIPEPSVPESSQSGGGDGGTAGTDDRARLGELHNLRKRLVRMASRVVDMARETTRALRECDAEVAAQTRRSEAKIHRDESKIERQCTSVLTRFRFTSPELRLLTVALKVITELDKIGDLCASVCARVARLSEGPDGGATGGAEELADEVHAMLRDAVDAFVDGDAERAREVVRRDDEIDQTYSETIDGIARRMESGKLAPQQGIDLLSATKSLERIADHAARLAEHAVFLVEGRDIRHG
ncbi:MAG: phosphate signaling complex protein PhoU [Deltaproteobacteria bacterium]|jgi:phosphate transport system regulatory protein PhoU|nr:phosphate signaling complex protein PhoU [Deltaproteobacteria bacterium]MBW2533656.1 phosphate signaling complex protein PhoU [Deltaproteobacteria bacterium]